MSYLVSVRLMAYNHGKYISKAMEGILMQKTNFKIEVVVGDDFSTDNTLEIVSSFKDNDNIHINILERKEGDDYWKERKALGRLYNFVNIVENCSGKYVALLDGDDYWTDPYKLQKQVDFLETNEDCIVSFHNVNKLKDGVMKKFHAEDFLKTRFGSQDLFTKWFVPTSSIVFRKDPDFKFPSWFLHSSHGDLSLLLSLSLRGKFGYNSEVMGVYRLHEGGESRNFKPLGLIASYAFVFDNVVRDSNYELKEIGKNALIQIAEEQASFAANHISDARVKKIVDDPQFASKNISFMQLLKIMFFKIRNRLF